MKPKPNPDTQARVDATDQARLAKAKADAAELTLDRWLAMARNVGVTSVRFNVNNEGITIRLKGHVDRRNVSLDQLCPHGQPLSLYASLAVSRFEQSMSSRGGYDAPLPDEIAATVELDDRVPQQPVDDEARSLLSAATTERERARQAAEIARRSNPINIHKPPPAGAGERRPLSLPLCKQCESQPVYQQDAEFCGGSCAKQWHVASVAAMRGVKLP